MKEDRAAQAERAAHRREQCLSCLKGIKVSSTEVGSSRNPLSDDQCPLPRLPRGTNLLTTDCLPFNCRDRWVKLFRADQTVALRILVYSLALIVSNGF
jgi:hypothetical protein